MEPRDCWGEAGAEGPQIPNAIKQMQTLWPQLFIMSSLLDEIRRLNQGSDWPKQASHDANAEEG
jgi:hypothetical protein